MEAVETYPSDGVDFFRRFDLPPLRRMTEEEAQERVESLQVVRRLRALRLAERDIFTPERRWKAIYNDRRREQALSPERGEPTRFEGTKVSELNRFLAEGRTPVVHVLAGELEVDETLRVPSRTHLVGAPTRLAASTPHDSGIVVSDGVGVRISDFEVTGRFRFGIYVKNGSSITLDANHVHDIDGRAIVVMGNVIGLDIIRNTVRSNGRGGIYIRGDIGPGLIQENRIEANRGKTNLMAGLLISTYTINDIDDPEFRCPPGEELPPLQTRLEGPHDLVVRRNFLERNNSSGIYCDGGYLISFIENSIVDNEKEGICLDFGSLGNFLRGNRISGNGGRKHQTDEELIEDFIHHFGRMEDGSAKAKLPGLSLDNAAYNIIHANTLDGNYGGGIKMVRTGVRNLICHNVILDNNRGQNDIFHFFGVELGAATADFPTTDLDIAADFENMVFRNTIDGIHYAGMFVMEGCYRNDFFDNCIFGTSLFSMESLANGGNSTVNNISNVPSRGIPLDMTREVPPAPPEVHEVHEAPPEPAGPARPGYPGVVRKCGRRVKSWYRSARGSVSRA